MLPVDPTAIIQVVVLGRADPQRTGAGGHADCVTRTHPTAFPRESSCRVAARKKEWVWISSSSPTALGQ